MATKRPSLGPPFKRKEGGWWGSWNPTHSSLSTLNLNTMDYRKWVQLQVCSLSVVTCLWWCFLVLPAKILSTMLDICDLAFFLVGPIIIFSFLFYWKKGKIKNKKGILRWEIIDLPNSPNLLISLCKGIAFFFLSILRKLIILPFYFL